MIKTDLKNNILKTMIQLVNDQRTSILEKNKIDLDAYQGNDQAMYDRLKIDNDKIEGMIHSIQTVLKKPDPVNVELTAYGHPKGMKIYNRTAPFGTILIIYESRPDVTIEAAALAFKAGNKILLKGGKEARHSNLILVNLWQQALLQHGIDATWIQYLNFNREQTQQFLKAPTQPVDLIVPRGGDRLIHFVKTHANVPVLVSGRGNNFCYVHHSADWGKAKDIIINAKTDKISACNALDKLLIDKRLPDLQNRLDELISTLQNTGVEVLGSTSINNNTNSNITFTNNPTIWKEEFLSMKIFMDMVDDEKQAITLINEHSGRHSVSILTEDTDEAENFMVQIDAAAVYHNASTRFTDGGEFGMGAELAISTDKLHHRGPLGLDKLVTNKWFVYGAGQVR